MPRRREAGRAEGTAAARATGAPRRPPKPRRSPPQAPRTRSRGPAQAGNRLRDGGLQRAAPRPRPISRASTRTQYATWRTADAKYLARLEHPPLPGSARRRPQGAPRPAPRLARVPDGRPAVLQRAVHRHALKNTPGSRNPKKRACPPTSPTSAPSPTRCSSTSPTTSASTRSQRRGLQHRALCLMDTLGCGLEALEYPRLHQAARSARSRHRGPHGAKVPGTSSSSIPCRPPSTSAP